MIIWAYLVGYNPASPSRKLRGRKWKKCAKLREIWLKIVGWVALKLAKFAPKLRARCMVVEYKRYKNPPLIWTNWNSDWEQSGPIRAKAGLCRHCGSHLSVASLIAPEQWCSSSSSSVIMGEGRASLPTSQLYTWIVRWKVIT